MHDLDRTQLEMEWEAAPYDEYEAEYEYGYEPEYEMEYETDPGGYGEFYEQEMFEGPFDEAEEMELAADLLEVMDEAELEQFLGKVFKRVSRVARQVLPRAVRGPLGGMLKGVARRYLPVAGSALGNLIVPGAGGTVGGRLASAAGRMFGLELEGLSPEDQEFEVARRFVRLAGEAARRAAAAPATSSPQAVAKQAIATAVQKQAPGLVAGGMASPAGASPRRPRRQGGRWIRRGRTIILMGV